VRGETVRKFRIGSILWSCELAQLGRKAPFLPLRTTQETPLRPVPLFSKQFQKNSRKFVSSILHKFLNIQDFHRSAPVQLPNPKPNMLWCWIDMHFALCACT
jgi:hypothetical protein